MMQGGVRTMWTIPKKSKDKERDPEKEFRMAVGILMKAECERHSRCADCRFNEPDIECVTVMRECGV